MRLALPVSGGAFSEHFGRCDGFFLCEVEPGSAEPRQPRVLPRPKTRCESVPRWLASLGVNCVLVGGIGAVAVKNLQNLGIRVGTGYRGQDPLAVVKDYLANPQAEHENPCATFEHRHHHCHG